MLTWVQFSWCQEDHVFTSLEEALTVAPSEVYRLDLSRSKLDAIPPEIYNFSNLKWLSLSRNKIDTISAKFDFKHLAYLDLSKNKFQAFPEAICNLGALKNLHLQKKDIDSIPSCIGQMKNLEKLDLWFNPIDFIADELVECKKLKSLDLRGVTFSNDFQKKWIEKMPWVKFEFDLGCDCQN